MEASCVPCTCTTIFGCNGLRSELELKETPFVTFMVFSLGRRVNYRHGKLLLMTLMWSLFGFSRGPCMEANI